MTPTSKALPEIRPWTQNHATLQWRFDREAKAFVVHGFGQPLQCAPPLDPEAQKKQQEADNAGVYAFLFGKDSRAGPSGADPSALVKELISNEEDVLHVPTLPTFGGKLNQSASEMLVSYLTVPYIRIPLLLNLLATPEHIGALGNREIQSVLDGALFEPGTTPLSLCFALLGLETHPIPFHHSAVAAAGGRAQSAHSRAGARALDLRHAVRSAVQRTAEVAARHYARAL